jgi:hypothetical protein
MEKIDFKLGEKYAVENYPDPLVVSAIITDESGTRAWATVDGYGKAILYSDGTAECCGAKSEIFGLYQPLPDGFRYVSRTEKPEDGIFYYSTVTNKWRPRQQPKLPLDLIYHKTTYARKIEAPKKLVPFDRGDMASLRGKIVVRKNSPNSWLECSEFSGSAGYFYINGVSSQHLLEYHTFEDGTPCGKWV